MKQAMNRIEKIPTVIYLFFQFRIMYNKINFFDEEKLRTKCGPAL